MKVKLLVEGGDMKPSPALSQKLGPAGINIGQIIQKVNDSTKDFQGMKVPVELDVDVSTKNFDVNVFSPPVSGLLKKELEIEKGSGMQKKLQSGNASIEQIISIAKTKLPDLLCRDLKSAVKTVIGTCGSLGLLVENKPAPEIEKDIDKGKYDKEIREEKTETSEEKKKKLKEYFERVKAQEEKAIEEEEKEAEEAKEAAAEVKEGAEGEKAEAKEEETEEKKTEKSEPAEEKK